MALQTAILSLTKHLDRLARADDNSISSNEPIKEKALTCMFKLLDESPREEYHIMAESTTLLSYNVTLLLRLAKEDKSNKIKLCALEALFLLFERLAYYHDDLETKCSNLLAKNSLPGVSSKLFRLIMSDTKLPRKILVNSIKIIAKCVSVVMSKCSHQVEIGEQEARPGGFEFVKMDISDVCQNFSVRFAFLIDYVTVNSDKLASEVKFEMLLCCEAIVRQPEKELIALSINSIVRYTSFIMTAIETPRSLKNEIQVHVMIIMDHIQQALQECDSNKLETSVISNFLNLVDELHEHSLTMLVSEREANLAILSGYFRLMSEANLTTVLELTEKREKIISIFTILCEFASHQPFLFLTNSQVDSKAIEEIGKRIYTAEKRFQVVNHKELNHIETCCATIGRTCAWLCLEDLISNDLMQFKSASNLYVTCSIFKGCLERKDLGLISKIGKFISTSIQRYIDEIQQIYLEPATSPQDRFSSESTLKIVIAVESIVVLMRLHSKIYKSKPENVRILLYLLCPLLSWASSSSRAISEASLSSLMQISQLYDCDSTKSLIEANVDYIVEGVGKMLHNYNQYNEVTNVLAIVLKLSSVECLYHFNDIYDKILKILGQHHLSRLSKPISLLFYRTLSVLSDWKDSQPDGEPINEVPLQTDTSISQIIRDIDIDRRIDKLREKTVESERIRAKIREMEKSEGNQTEVLDDIRTGNMEQKLDSDCEIDDEGKEDRDGKAEPSAELQFTKKLLTATINLVSSNHDETKINSLHATAKGLRLLRNDEDTLLPLVHQLWTPLVKRLTGDYNRNLEVNLSAFECLVAAALYSKDFIKRRTLDSVIPRVCLFLESQHKASRMQKEYGAYCMTLAYRCQLNILSQLGCLAYHIQLSYSSLWRVIKALLIYLDLDQPSSLQKEARKSCLYLMALDPYCVWWYAKKSGYLNNLPFELIFES